MPSWPLPSVIHLQTLASVEAGAEGWAFKLSTPDAAADTDRSSIWWLDRQHRLTRLTVEHESAFGPRWSPCGRKIAFLRSINGKTQVLSLSLDGGEARQLSNVEDGVVSIEDWVDDRLLILAHRGSAPGTAPYVVDHLPYKTDGIGPRVGQATYLYQLEAETGRMAAIVADGGDVVEACCSPDGETIAYVQKRDGAQRHTMDIWLKRRGDRARRLAAPLVSMSGLAWSPDGRHIAIGGSRMEGSSMSSLFVIEIPSGQARRIDVELATPTTIEWTGDSSALMLLEAYCGNQRIARVGLDGEVVPLREFEARQVFDFAIVGEEMAFVAAGPADGPELWACALDGNNPIPISRFNEWRDDAPKLQAERHYFDVPDGLGGRERIDGWLLSPASEGPFPLLLDMHGGPHSLVTFEHESHGHWQPAIDRGWAVLALNPVGTNSYGEEFARRLCGHWGELDLPQWLAAVRALREQGVVNHELAVFGHSYGGFLSAWALAQNVPLVCGVVSAGVLNMESHTGTSDTGYYVGPYAMKGELDAERERYDRLSPVRYASQVRAPTLLLQGDDDQRCPIGQAEEFFARLIRQGQAKARMVVFPGGTHHVSSTGRPSHRVAFYRHVIDWLCEHRDHADTGHRVTE